MQRQAVAVADLLLENGDPTAFGVDGSNALVLLLRDRRVRLLDLALQNFNIDLDLSGHHVSFIS